MSISFSGLASGLDTASWVTSLTQLRQAKVTKLEEQKSSIVAAQSTLQGIRSFFSSFRASLEKITDSKFKVSSMDIFSKKVAAVSNAAVLSATAKSNAAEGSYEVKVNNIATQTQVKSGYRYKTALVSTTQATTSSYLKNVGIGYGSNTESGVTPGDIEITHNDVTSTISISANETMNSFLDKLHAAGIEADFNNETGIFSIGVNVGDINDIGGTNILNKLKISDINYGYTGDQLKIEEEHDEYHQATNETLLSELGVSVGTLVVHTANGDYEVTLDEDETIGSLVSSMRDAGIEAAFNDGIFSINNACIINDGTTGLIEHFGLSTPDIASHTQESEGLTYQTVYTQTTTAQMGSLLKDIDGVTLESTQTLVVQNAAGEQNTITVGTTTTVGDLVTALNQPTVGLDVSYNESTGVLSINDGWIVDGGTFDVEAAFGLVYTGVPETVTGNALTVTTTTVTGATNATKLKDLTTAVTSGTIKVTDTTDNVHNFVVDENWTIGQLVSNIRSLGLGANFDETTGVLTLTGGSYTTEGVPVGNASNVLDVFYGTNTLSPSAIDSAVSTSQALRENVITTHNATGTTTLHELGMANETYTATFQTGATEVEIEISGSTTLNGLKSLLRTNGIDADFNAGSSQLTLTGAEYLGVSGGNFGEIMNFTETITGRYATSNSVLSQTVTIGKEMTSAGAVYHTIYATTTTSTTQTITNSAATTSGVLDYQYITTLVDGTTEGLEITGTELGYGSVTTTGTSQTTGELTYTVVEGGTTETVGINSTGSTVYYSVTTAAAQTSGSLMQDVTVTNPATTTTAGATASSGVLTVDTDMGMEQTSVVTYQSVNPASTNGIATTINSNVLAYDTVTTTTTVQDTLTTVPATATTYALGTVGDYVSVVTDSTVGLSQTSAMLCTGYITITESTTFIGTDYTPGTAEASYNGFMTAITTVVAQTTVTSATELADAISTYTTIGIGNADVLAELASLVNAGTNCLNKTIVLTNDIDLSDYQSGTGWTAIGTSSNQFRGTFDGNGCVVSNLYISDNTTDYHGLFGYAGRNATIKNVGVSGEVEGRYNAGLLAGYGVSCLITNTYATGTVSATTSVGGLVGYMKESTCTVSHTDCLVSADVMCLDTACGTGGLIGVFDSASISNKLEQCYATGDVSGGYNVGGLVGKNRGYINCCFASGDVSGTNYVGGLFGSVWYTQDINRCYASGDVSGRNYVGGLIGSLKNDVNSSAVLQHSCALGNVTGSGSCVGGLLGEHKAYQITNCYARGDVTSTGSGNGFGGLIGYTNSNQSYITIKQSYAIGDIIGADDGLMGNASGCTITDCYYGTGTFGIAAAANKNMYSIGVSGTGKISVSDGTTITVGGTTTISSLVSQLQGKGINASYNATTGLLTIGEPNSTYQGYITGITGSNLESKLGIHAGEGTSYSSSINTVVLEYTASLGELGMIGDGVITLMDDSTYTFTTSNTVDNVCYYLNTLGYATTAYDGIMSFSPTSNLSSDNIIKSMSSNLSDALGLTGHIGANYTYANGYADSEVHQIAQTMDYWCEYGGISLSTQISSIYHPDLVNMSTWDYKIFGTNGETLSVSAEDTLADLLNGLHNTLGIDVQAYGDGALISPDDVNTYNTITFSYTESSTQAISNIEYWFGGFGDQAYDAGWIWDIFEEINIGYGRSYTRDANIVEGGIETVTVTTTLSATATGDTFLGELGLSANGYIYVNGDQRVTVTTHMTVDSLISALGDKTITASLTDGALSITNTADHYITELSSSISAFFDDNVIGGHSVVGAGSTYYEVASVTITALATGTTTFYELQNDGHPLEVGLGDTIGVIGTSDRGSFTVREGHTIDDVVDWLSDTCGISAKFSNGVLTVGSTDDTHWLTSISSELRALIGIDAGEGISHDIQTLTATTTSQLGSILPGFVNGSTITTNEDVYTFRSTDTIQSILNSFDGVHSGIRASFSDGRLTFESVGDEYITGMSASFRSLTNINAGEGVTYNSNVNPEYYTTTSESATSSTTLGELGLAAQGWIRLNDRTTITVETSTSLSTLISDLSSNSVTASLTNGVLTVGDSGDSKFIAGISPNLSNILHIYAGEDVSYSTGGSTTATSASTLASLGMTGDSAVVETNTSTFTVSSTATVQDVINGLNSAGLSASITNGQLTVSPTSGHYLKMFSSNLAMALGFETGYDKTYGINNIDGETTVVTATESTTFAQLGMLSAGKIVTTNGTITVETSDTIGSLISCLSTGSIGITASISDGEFTLWQVGDSNIVTSISPSLTSVLGLEGGEGSSYGTSTNTVNATTATVLTTLGMQNNSSGVIRTNTGNITIASSSTVQDVINELSSNGFTASLSAEHTFCITPSDGHYIESVSPALAAALGIDGPYYTIIDEQTQTVTTIATTATQLSTLGMTANSAQIITNNSTINVSKTDTIKGLMDKLTAAGISSSFNTATGEFTLGSVEDENYVTAMSTQLASALGDINIGLGFTYNHGSETIYTTTTTSSSQTIDGSTTFGELGISAGGGVITLSNGQTVTVNSSTTVSSFLSDISGKGITTTLSNGLFNMEPQDGVFIQNQSGDDILSAMNLVGTTYTANELTLANTKLKDLKNSLGVNLGITSGAITAYKNGIANNIYIDNNSTLEDLASQLSNYNIQMSFSSGSSGNISFASTGNSYLQSVAEGSNLLSALGATSWGTVINTASQTLQYETGNDVAVNGSTKLIDLKDSSGNSLGITTGKYKITASGINYEGTISATTSIDDFFTDIARYGLSGSINSNGEITISTANDDTYLEKANGAVGYSNIVDTVFPSWTFGNIYTSGSMDVTDVNTTNMTSETKLKDIDQGTFKAGKVIVSSSQSGDTIIELDEEATVGDFMAALSYHGFNSYIENGRLIARNDGYTTLKNYTVPSQASNVISLLGLDTSEWEQPGYYTGSAQTATTYDTVLEAATRNTTLANLRDAEGNSLGITTGKYIVHSNGITHTLNLSSTDITLDSFINTLAGYNINAIFDTQDGQSFLKLVGSGDSYVENSSALDASNVITKLFGNEGPSTLYNYSGYEQTTETVSTTVVASLGTSLSDYDHGDVKSEGIFAINVDGNYSEINITSYETFGSLLEKFQRAGVNASMTDGVIRLETGNRSFVVDNEHTTSHLLENLDLHFSDNLGGFAASYDSVTQTTTTIEDRTLSVAKYADDDTQLGLLNISSGTISIFRNGQKKLINIDNTETFGALRTKLQAEFADLNLDFENGKLRFFSTSEGVDVQVGSSNDTSNMSSICGFSQDENGYIVSARELYKVNASSVITNSNLFRLGDVTEGTFVIGDETFTITNSTTIQNIISQINSSEKANASAYWDSVDGKLVISARTTGASVVNIEAGTSNFTDILGLTASEWNGNGSVKVTRILRDSQEIGKNAKFSINGTNFQSASNVVTSDVSRIQGLTINLKGSSMGDTVTINVTKDAEAVTEAVGEFVESYNELVENVDAELNSSGVLKDQSTLKFIKQQIRNLLVNTFAGATTFRNLAALGISTSAGNSIGVDTSNAGIEYLYFDSEKFMEGYNKDPDAVKNMLVGSDETPGILIQIENIVENALATGTGYFSTADKSYSDKISSINEKIRKANQAIEAYRARLESKFQSMDMLISQMQNQYNSFLKTSA